MVGLIYSERQLNIYRFIERVGPCPLAALEILFGKKTEKALKRLRREDYIYNLVINGIEFWTLHSYGQFNPGKQELMAWFIVRLVEKQGKYLGNGVCLTPNGITLNLIPGRGTMLITDDKGRKLIAQLLDLKKTTLDNCLKWENKKTLQNNGYCGK